MKLKSKCFTKEEKIARYGNMIFRYGFLALLFLMEEYQEKEDYEECQLILDSLNAHKKKWVGDLPTQYGEGAVMYFRKAMFNITGVRTKLSIRNIREYVELIKKELNQ